MNYKIIYFILLIIVLASCNTEIKKNRNKMLNIERDSLIQNTKYFDDLFVESDFVKLEYKDSILVKKVSDIIISEKDSLIVLLDEGNNQVFIYSSIGNLKNIIGKKGKGPNEYSTQISCIYYDNATLYVYVDNKLFIYNINGELLQIHNMLFDNQELTFSKFYIVGDLFYGVQQSHWNLQNDLTVYSIKDKKIIKIYNNACTEKSYGFTRSLFIKISDKYLIYTGCYSDKIFQIDLKTNKEKAFADIKPSKLPESFLKLKTINEQSYWFVSRPNYILGIEPYLELFVIEEYTFLGKPSETYYKFEVYDLQGNFIKTLRLLDFDKLAQKKLYVKESYDVYFYQNGIILIGFDKTSKEQENYSLVFLKFKK